MSNSYVTTDICGTAWQVHIRKGRPVERLLFQTAEVVVTAAAVCMITLAFNHIRHRSSSKQLVGKPRRAKKRDRHRMKQDT